jgi:hypothetical protein
MSGDLTGMNVPQGKNKKRNHGGEGRAGSEPKNPGSKFFDVLFENVIIKLAANLANQMTVTTGHQHNPNKPMAHCALYNYGGGDEQGMRKIDIQLMTMSMAFNKDNRTVVAEELPGPNMQKAIEDYYSFLEATYPTVLHGLTDEYWREQKKLAKEEMLRAYTIWTTHNENKPGRGAGGAAGGAAGGVDGGVDGGAAGGAAKARKKRAKKSASEAGGKNAESVSSPKEQGTESDEDPVTSALQVAKEVRFQVMDIVGLPVQAEVVASFEPGEKLSPGIPMATAVRIVKTEPDAPGGDAVTASSQDKHVAASCEDKNAIRAANRKAAKLLPSSEVVDLTGDD